jgi:hypothetical protein
VPGIFAVPCRATLPTTTVFRHRHRGSHAWLYFWKLNPLWMNIIVLITVLPSIWGAHRAKLHPPPE